MKTISKIVSSSMKEQRSEFIAFLYPIDEVSQVKITFNQHSERYKDATHNCYAYIIGKKQEWQYYSDQGEPSGTAGKPILNTLLKYELTNVLAIVTRYYGGIKLGVRGLIDAYSDVTEEVINHTELLDFCVMERILVSLDYSILDSVKHFLKNNIASITVLEYSEEIAAEVQYPQDRSSEVLNYLNDLAQKGLIRFNLTT